MRWYTKSNKKKSWRRTYGKPFIARRAVKMAMISVTSAMGIATAACICSTIATGAAGVAMKALAVADVVMKTAKSISDAKIGGGFANKIGR